MFGRITVADLDRRGQVVHDDDARVLQRGPRDRCSRQRCELGLELTGYRGCQFRRCRDEHDLGVGTVLRLGKQVRGHEFRGGVGVPDHEDF